MTSNDTVIALLEERFTGLDARLDREILPRLAAIERHAEKTNGHVEDNARISRENRERLAGINERLNDAEEGQRVMRPILQHVNTFVAEWDGRQGWQSLLNQAFLSLVSALLGGLMAAMFGLMGCTLPGEVANPTGVIETYSAPATVPLTATRSPTPTAVPTVTATSPPTIEATPTVIPTPDYAPTDTPVPTGEPGCARYEKYGVEICPPQGPDYTPPTAVAAENGYVWRVVEGNTLWGISRQCEVSVEELAEENDLDPPYLLTVGQTIVVPGVEECH